MIEGVPGKKIEALVPWDTKPDTVGWSVSLNHVKRLTHCMMSKHHLLIINDGMSDWIVTPSRQLSLEGH